MTKFFVATLFVFILNSASVVNAQSTIEEICGSVQSVVGCNAIITLPTGFDVKYCKNKFVKTNPCKSKVSFTTLCPTLRKPGRTCTTTKSRFDEFTIDIPCGLNLKTEKVNICNKIRQALPGGQDLIAKSMAMCECLPAVLALGGEAAIDDVEVSDFSSGTSRLLAAFAKYSKCLADNGFAIRDDKSNLEAPGGDLSTSDGWIVIRALEIDLSLYIQLAEAIVLCAYSRECNEIGTVLTNYAQDSVNFMSDSLKSAIIAPWENLLNGINSTVTNLGNNLPTLATNFIAIQTEVLNVQNQLCQTTEQCLEPSVSDFYNKVTETISRAEPFYQVQASVAEFLSAVKRMKDILDNRAADFSLSADPQSMIELVTSGQFRQIRQVVEIFKIAKELPEFVKSLGDNLNLGTNFLPDLSLQTTELEESLLATTSPNWLNGPLTTNASLSDARDSIQRVQAMLRDQVNLVRSVTSNINGAYGRLQQLPFHGAEIVVHPGVASYRRWSEVSMDLVCSKMTTQRYNYPGLKSISFDYPEFKTCRYGPKRVSWPNHHIPYIKLKFSA
ncbi:hypothetical protein PV08_00183 [Exophiala spinifera]|uniref:Karyogamy protein 5 n=1 Tax=Exophiala spinifera TaxID=91928 RepID=A0A0D2BM00_9EURO|nr:uncharacterized protein PV08_00183 [Exophiala spinifera]KIW19610.1 hypothetical protein PV08_00183 [Exophiala spinifera]